MLSLTNGWIYAHYKHMGIAKDIQYVPVPTIDSKDNCPIDVFDELSI